MELSYPPLFTRHRCVRIRRGRTITLTKLGDNSLYLEFRWIGQGGTERRHRVIAVHAQFIAGISILNYDCKNVCWREYNEIRVADLPRVKENISIFIFSDVDIRKRICILNCKRSIIHRQDRQRGDKASDRREGYYDVLK